MPRVTRRRFVTRQRGWVGLLFGLVEFLFNVGLGFGDGVQAFRGSVRAGFGSGFGFGFALGLGLERGQRVRVSMRGRVRVGMCGGLILAWVRNSGLRARM